MLIGSQIVGWTVVEPLGGGGPLEKVGHSVHGPLQEQRILVQLLSSTLNRSCLPISPSPGIACFSMTSVGTHTHMCLPTLTHTHKYIPCTHTHSCECSHSHTCAYTCSCTCTCTYPHSPTHICMPMHTRVCVCTYYPHPTYTYILKNKSKYLSFKKLSLPCHSLVCHVVL